MSDNAAAIAELDEQIAEIESILTAGTTEATVAGERVRYDLPFLSQRVQQLIRRRDKLKEPDATLASPLTRIDMSGS